jgi:hypothetical protein
LNNGATGSITFIGTVSPAGGNLKEPVTESTKKQHAVSMHCHSSVLIVNDIRQLILLIVIQNTLSMLKSGISYQTMYQKHGSAK